jgi:hypothetical protein
MRFVAWFQIVIGVAVAGLWTVLLATGQVPEVPDGRVDIWFHIAAEMVMAAALLTGGVVLLRARRLGPLLSAFALGWLGYSAVNSPGYYAEAGEWAAVGMFAAVVAATVGALTALWRHSPDGEPTPDGAQTAVGQAKTLTGGRA